MASATAIRQGWADHTELTPSDGGKSWMVQKNVNGAFRCSCPAYIFSKAPKGCKHVARVKYLEEENRTLEPYVEEASSILTEMLQHVGLNRSEFVGPELRNQMGAVLALRLQALSTIAVTVASPTAATRGVRKIRFDD